MKKTILAIALLVASATSSMAISFSWASATAIKFDGANLKSNPDVTGYLVYLGSGGSYADSYTLEASSTPDSVVSSVGTQLSSLAGTSGMSKISTKATFDFGTYNNGDVFGMLLTYVKDGTTYYNLSSSTYTLSGITDETSGPDGASFAFSYDTKGESSSLSSGGGWTVAVPEPSTAALALAGLALLLKRRRA